MVNKSPLPWRLKCLFNRKINAGHLQLQVQTCGNNTYKNTRHKVKPNNFPFSVNQWLVFPPWLVLTGPLAQISQHMLGDVWFDQRWHTVQCHRSRQLCRSRCSEVAKRNRSRSICSQALILFIAAEMLYTGDSGENRNLIPTSYGDRDIEAVTSENNMHHTGNTLNVKLIEFLALQLKQHSDWSLFPCGNDLRFSLPS